MKVKRELMSKSKVSYDLNGFGGSLGALVRLSGISSTQTQAIAVFSSLFVLNSIVAMTPNTGGNEDSHPLGSTLNFLDFVVILPYFVHVLFEAFSNLKDQCAREDLRTKVVKLSRIFHVL